MAKTRVLIVDDAAVFRRVLMIELSADPDIEVVGTAADGRIALAKLPQVTPDLVILDVEMPVLDGLATLRELRKLYPKLPVIMFSALTERGAAATLDALALGATDYFAKPVADGLDASLQIIRNELIPAIKAICRRTIETVKFAPAPMMAAPRTAAQIVAIATSTGGPNALAEVFAALPGDLPVPIVIVQHMPPMFTRLLAERLTSQFSIRVEEGRAGAVLEPGSVWIAPGDHHMTVTREGHQVRLGLNQGPHENSCRPAADVLFRSVARAFGPAALGVVLTGMGQDGLRGCEAIKAIGGQVLAQDEPSSVVWGMPGFVSRTGLADRILPLSLIASEIVCRTHFKRGVVR